VRDIGIDRTVCVWGSLRTAIWTCAVDGSTFTASRIAVDVDGDEIDVAIDVKPTRFDGDIGPDAVTLSMTDAGPHVTLSGVTTAGRTSRFAGVAP